MTDFAVMISMSGIAAHTTIADPEYSFFASLLIYASHIPTTTPHTVFLAHPVFERQKHSLIVHPHVAFGRFIASSPSDSVLIIVTVTVTISCKDVRDLLVFVCQREHTYALIIMSF